VSNESSNIDPVLSLLVSGINNLEERQDEGAGITLTVQGLVVSGRIIPNWQWFGDLEQQNGDHAAHPAGKSDDPGGDSGDPAFKSLKDELIEMRTQAKIADELAEGLPLRYRQALLGVDRTEYIHLRDARAFPTSSAHPIPTTGGTHWRGKLADVSGWSFGMLAVRDDDRESAV
jgi:hypothetical protein